MMSSSSSRLLVIGAVCMSVRGFITCRATVSVKSKMEWIISFSSSSITPSSSPASTSILSSSSVRMGAENLTWMPNGLTSKSLKKLTIFTAGSPRIDRKLITPPTVSAIFSARCIARLFGATSPRISVTKLIKHRDSDHC